MSRKIENLATFFGKLFGGKREKVSSDEIKASHFSLKFDNFLRTEGESIWISSWMGKYIVINL